MLPACSEGEAVAGRFLIFPNLQIWQGLGGVIAIDILPASNDRTERPAQIPVGRFVQRALRR